jgi:hypothetical protein
VGCPGSAAEGRLLDSASWIYYYRIVDDQAGTFDDPYVVSGLDRH